MTAADPFEPSASCYWDDLRDTFLGDQFSVLWMQLAQNVSPISHLGLGKQNDKENTELSSTILF